MVADEIDAKADSKGNPGDLSIVNIAAYQFVSLSDLENVRDGLLKKAELHGIAGTILLSEEGINLFIAGEAESIDDFMAELIDGLSISNLAVKRSVSRNQPFRRMVVQIRSEIITFGVKGVDPQHDPAPRISPLELKQWLDAGHPVRLLDTRNDFEVRFGSFQKAETIGIERFRDFAEAARKLPDEWRKVPVVTFCTGGIRCEKAAPYLRNLGFQNVYQLDGGILAYFEECGGVHWDGDCFVFDERIAIGPDLLESGVRQCVVCQGPIPPGGPDQTIRRCAECQSGADDH